MSDLTIQQNISLQAYNTLAIDVQTRWFAQVTTDAELQDVLLFLQRQYLQEQSSQKPSQAQCPLLVLGGGSNVVLVDDFVGLTIVLQTQGIQIENETDEQVFLSVAAGENWHNTVMHCVDNGWYGIENLALIPGSVGAAPIQNIGAYGVELTQILSYVEAIDLASGELIRLNNADCHFAYRDSIFKGELKDKVIITRVVLVLSKTPVWSLDYPALQEALAGHNRATLSSHTVANAVINIRNSKLPDPADIPNAGSFFKNPIVSQQCYERIQQAYPKVVAFPVTSIPTGTLPAPKATQVPIPKRVAGAVADTVVYIEPTGYTIALIAAASKAATAVVTKAVVAACVVAGCGCCCCCFCCCCCC